MRVVVSDTSPICYLVLIGEAALLEKLYGRILIPQAVYDELQRPQAPEELRRWIASAPDWVDVISTADASISPLVSASLGGGERSAIGLALKMKADLLLIDERAGSAEAQRLGLTVSGTLGVLARSAERGFIRLVPVLDRLLATNFRVHPEIIRQLILEEARRLG